MGTYKFYKLDFATWSDRICGDRSRGEHWRTVFMEHPEFFRLDAGRSRASLVLRRQRRKLYNVDEQRERQRDKYLTLSQDEKLRFSRSPLHPAEIEALIDVAINLHTRATERARDRRALITSVLAFVGGLLGALLSHHLQ